MTNWDDQRYFLAIARSGSVRKASAALGVSHSTVIRRITLFEQALGVRLFERMPNGYITTPAGEDLLEFALRMESEALAATRRVAGRDNELKGKIRLTIPAILASHLLMPDLVAFRQAYPAIELEIISSYEVFDLSKLEADVAIRLTDAPAEYLFGRRLLDMSLAAYVSKDYLNEPGDQAIHPTVPCIGPKDAPSLHRWRQANNLNDIPMAAYIEDPQICLEAVKAGMGMAILPCFLGDGAAELRRLPPGITQHHNGLWVLTHEDLRHTSRIRIFMRYMANAIERHQDLLTGHKPNQGLHCVQGN